MPALSVNGCADERQASRGKSAKADDLTSQPVDEMAAIATLSSSKRNRKKLARDAKRKVASKHLRNTKDLNPSVNKRKDGALAQTNNQLSVETSEITLKRKVDGFCESIGKDRDAGMRVAEKSRNNAGGVEDPGDAVEAGNKLVVDSTILKMQEEARKGKCNNIGDVLLPVKTYEKGEIVVSMDGELLLVAPVLQEVRLTTSTTTSERRDSNSSNVAEDENERSLGSIEEPDVLECWEAETVEPVATPKKVLQGDTLTDEDVLAVINGSDTGLEHVQKYYRLQADSSITTSVNEEVEEEDDEEDDNTLCDNNNLALNDDYQFDTASKSSVPNSPDSSNSSSSSICSNDVPPQAQIISGVPVMKGKSIAKGDNRRLPIDEAFEVYESCYTGKPPPVFPFSSIDPKFGIKGRWFGSRDEEGPVPCRDVCCSLQ